MIKTMLLTAQLALSPIAVANGLQPKNLPNPVYGESVDYSVTYNGETYTRIMSGNYYARNITQIEEGDSIFWGTTIGQETQEDQQKVASDNLTWATETNLIKATTDYYISWLALEGGEYTQDEFMLPESNTCFSFWLEKPNMGFLIYVEIFNSPQGSKTQTINQWWFTKTNNQWVNADYVQPQKMENINTGDDLYTIDPYEIADWGDTKRNIQKYQPSNPNPSVYDNIYNFYYQNLFANEALDELGAEVGNNSLTMRQWLAHTATIVSISLLAVALAVLVIKIFKLIAGSISDIWG